MSKMLLVSCGRASAPNKILTSLSEYINAHSVHSQRTRKYRTTIKKSSHKGRGQLFILYVNFGKFKSVDANLLLTGTFL